MANEASYADLEIRILKREETGYPVDITLNNERQFKRGYLAPRAESESWDSIVDPVKTGQELFDWFLADGNLKETWGQVRELRPYRIRLRLDREAPELHAIPWELLQEPGEGDLTQNLAQNIETPFSRYLEDVRSPGKPIDKRPLKMLVAIANPDNLEADYGLSPIKVEQEWTLIKELTQGVAITCDRLPQPCTLSALEDKLKGGYHILHFIGHGRYNQEGGEAALFLADEANQVTLVKDKDFAGMLASQLASSDLQNEDKLQLVFLTSCQTATRSPTDALRGFAPSLVAAGLPAVLAMQGLVTADTARTFTRTFYQQLLVHGLVDRACNEARAKVQTERKAGPAIPVLFMRLETGQLLAPNQVLDCLEAIRLHHDEFFSPANGRYLDLPIEVIHLTQEQLALGHSRRMLNTTARLDLLETVRDYFSRMQTETGQAKTDEAQPNVLLLVGSHGSNRSTQLKHIAWTTAQESLAPELEHPVIPLYIDVREYSGVQTTLGNPIKKLVLNEVRNFWPDLAARNLDDLLKSGIILRLLIDGSEHLPERERYTAWGFIKAFMHAYPHQQYMIATDLESLLSPRFDKSGLAIQALVMQPLDERKIRRFLQRRVEAPDNPDDPNLRLLGHLEQGQLFDLVDTPWFLVLVIEWAEKDHFPNSRTDVLVRIVDEAILKVPTNYGMRAHAETAIYRLAWEMQSGGERTWSVDQFFEMMLEVRGNRGYNLEDFYVALLGSGLLVPVGDHAVRFTYAPIQAYCCARAIARLPAAERHRILDDITATLGRISRLRRWEETLVSLSGLLARDPEALEDLLWLIVYGVNLFEGEQTFLAARCLLESRQSLADKALKSTLIDLPSQVINALVWRLEERNEPREAYRVQAAQLLGQLGYLEAYCSTVIPHLVRVTLKKDRRDSLNKPAYYYSSIRLAAATALQRLTAQESILTPTANAVIRSELLTLLKLWQRGQVSELIRHLERGQEELQAVAALALGDLYTLYENDPDAARLSEEITTALVQKFFDFALGRPLLWPVSHALSMLNSMLVYEKVIQPFIERDRQGKLDFPDQLLPDELNFPGENPHMQWYKCLVYLIGQTRCQEVEAHRFLLKRCFELADVRLWASVISALGWLGDERYNEYLVRIAIGKLSQPTPDYDFSKGDQFPPDQVEHFLQYQAIQALANAGNLETLERLRESSVNWGPELRQAFYHTSEEINWRISQNVVS